MYEESIPSIEMGHDLKSMDSIIAYLVGMENILYDGRPYFDDIRRLRMSHTEKLLGL